MSNGRKIPDLLPNLIPSVTNELREKIEIQNEENRIRDEQNRQRKKIQGKQVRALRNQYRSRAGGLLNAGDTDGGRGIGLGDANGLPTELGSA